MLKIVLALGATLALAGCITPHATLDAKGTKPSEPKERRVAEKNYALGQSKRSYVGDSMVRIRDYTVIETSRPAMVAEKSFTHAGTGVNGMTLNVEFTGTAGQEYPVKAESTMDGRRVLILDGVPGKSTNPGEPVIGRPCGFCLMVDAESGKIVNRVIYLNKYVQSGELATTPADAVFKPAAISSVVKSGGAPYTNIELVYSGIQAGAVRVAYREFSRDDLARPAFYQDLTYDASSKILRFRGIRLQIDQADNEQIVFTVLEDQVAAQQ